MRAPVGEVFNLLWHGIHVAVRTCFGFFNSLWGQAINVLKQPVVRTVWYWVKSPAIWAPVGILALATLLIWATDADRVVMRQFFAKPEGALHERWPLMIAQPWHGLYHWGVYPAWVVGCGGLMVWIASFFRLKLKRWRDPGLFLFLVMVIGPGILVNCVLKPFWNRPRPNATVDFGGQREFLPVGQRGQHQTDVSFPSGHAAMGFYLMTPAFFCYRRYPRWAIGFIALGLFAGGIIGLARIVAGGHFPSDVLGSGVVVYFTALALAALFHFGQPRPTNIS